MTSYGDLEVTSTACPTCGCREVFRDLTRQGEREQPVMLRCCQCHRERADLEFHEEAA